jgi:restriction system protein
MFGLMTAEHADETIIVTSGKFTRDAQDFATGKPIRLIDGSQLLALVQSVQAATQSTKDNADVGQNQVATPACPLCGKPMVQRTARRGANAGNQFWGCSVFPTCKGIRSVNEPDHDFS